MPAKPQPVCGQPLLVAQQTHLLERVSESGPGRTSRRPGAPTPTADPQLAAATVLPTRRAEPTGESQRAQRLRPHRAPPPAVRPAPRPRQQQPRHQHRTHRRLGIFGPGDGHERAQRLRTCPGQPHPDRTHAASTTARPRQSPRTRSRPPAGRLQRCGHGVHRVGEGLSCGRSGADGVCMFAGRMGAASAR